eukprot:TRINITY_DN5104_c0_g1_i19.p1 TRINITY_DN5104_c0_g1~~TRINITY_DN5104_c0_g1_i19.p1  ORF type:complete len:111 (+),score=21.70 TRINITY_DN5104_c0_g1_i19:147-479(+)
MTLKPSQAAVHTDMEKMWSVRLAKFEKGCSTTQLTLFNMRHQQADNFKSLFEVCLVGTEAAEGQVLVVQDKRGQRKGAQQMYFNCNKRRHTTDRCLASLTARSYKYWGAR